VLDALAVGVPIALLCAAAEPQLVNTSSDAAITAADLIISF
jgi:hypothetical protein